LGLIAIDVLVLLATNRAISVLHTG
jgi:hypothetical protein